MNARRPLLALAALVAGCSSPQQNAQKVPEGPKMPAVPPRHDVPIDAGLQRRAGEQIAAAYAASDPVSRAQALEAMARTNDPNAAARAMQSFADADALVRFAAAMCAGDLKLVGTRFGLVSLVDDRDPNVQVATRYALHRLGDSSRTKELETFAQSDDERVRANVALCVGLLGEPTGTRIVRPMLTDPKDSVRIAAAEALWALGDQQGLRNLVAGTISPFPDEQIVSTLALARPRDPKVNDFLIGKLAIAKTKDQYVEVQLAAARALGMIGDDAGFGVAVDAAKSNSPLQRSMAALALGAIRRSDAQATLGKLLDDKEASVRLAAALAIRQLSLPASAR